MSHQVFMGSCPSDDRFEAAQWDPHIGTIGKPKGGLWTSDLLPEGTSPWLEWVRTEQPDWRREAWVCELKPDIHTAHVWSRRDLVRLGIPESWDQLSQRFHRVRFTQSVIDSRFSSKFDVDEVSRLPSIREMLVWSLDVPSSVWLRPPSECFARVYQLETADV